MDIAPQTSSLQHLIQVKLVALQWIQQDILTSIEKLVIEKQAYEAIRENSTQWKKIEDRLIKNVSALPLPKKCKQPLLNLIKPFGIEIIRWCRYHYKEYYGELVPIVNSLPKRLCWTSLGTVDYKKTAELIVKDENLCIEERYKVACINCLEDEIRRLIRQIPEDRTKELVNSIKIYPRRRETLDLIVFWTYFINNEVDELDKFIDLRANQNYSQWIDFTHFQFAFYTAVKGGNRAAYGYFLKNLNREEIDEIIVECTAQVVTSYSWWPNYNMNDLMLQMSVEQQEQVFQYEDGDISLLLSCYLCWPCQALFVGMLQQCWRFLPKGDYAWLVYAIALKIFNDFKDYNYTELFEEVWHLSPSDYKEHFIDRVVYLEKLFQTKEKELIKLVLNEITALQLESYVNSDKQEIHRILLDESIICDEILNEWKAKINLNLVNEPRDAENTNRGKNLLRLIEDLLERRMKGS